LAARELSRLSVRDNLFLSVYWFSRNFLWGTLITVVIQVDILRFVAAGAKAAYLALVLAVGAATAMVVQPVAGALSDRWPGKGGRRAPFLLVGTLGTCGALLAMGYAPDLSWYLAGFVLVQLFSNVAGGAYNGLIPDVVPPEQRGTASGYMGIMLVLGAIAGLVGARFFFHPAHPQGFYWILAAVQLAGMALTVAGVSEPRGIAPSRQRWGDFWRSFWISPRRYPDFAWLFFTRLLVMLGFYTVLDFLAYYLRDVLHVAAYKNTTADVMLAAMLAATGASFLAGVVSDRWGRKSLVAGVGILMGITALAFALGDSLALTFLLGLLFGVGYGAYTSVDWALAIDVLPARAAAAKDMGIWSIAETLPQVVAAALGGGIVLALGYRSLFALTFFWFVLGSVFIWRIRGSR
jgi:MFS family permease